MTDEGAAMPCIGLLACARALTRGTTLARRDVCPGGRAEGRGLHCHLHVPRLGGHRHGLAQRHQGGARKRGRPPLCATEASQHCEHRHTSWRPTRPRCLQTTVIQRSVRARQVTGSAPELSVEQSTAKHIALIQRLTKADSGKYFSAAKDGEEIPY